MTSKLQDTTIKSTRKAKVRLEKTIQGEASFICSKPSNSIWVSKHSDLLKVFSADVQAAADKYFGQKNISLAIRNKDILPLEFLLDN